MKIALAQILSGPDPEENLAQVGRRIAEAAAREAELVVFPEATMATFARPSREVAEPIPGPWAEAVGRLAREAGVTVAVGMFTGGEGDGRVRNTLLLVGPGQEARYHKLHLYDAFGFSESDHILPGDEPVLVSIGGMTFGLAVCYDIRFPELFKFYARAGAQAVLVPASWAAGEGKVDQWQRLVVARALDSTCYVIGCGQADPRSVGVEPRSKAPTGVGHSLIAGPDGTVLAQAGAEPELILVGLDPQAVGRARETLPVLANSRFNVALTSD